MLDYASSRVRKLTRIRKPWIRLVMESTGAVLSRRRLIGREGVKAFIREEISGRGREC